MSVLTRNRKWPAFLSVVVTGAAVGGVLGALPATEASAITTPGVTVAGGNGAGPAANQLDGPEGLFVDKSGDVYVTDEGNNRVQEWSPGATSGVTVAGGNGSGAAANQLNAPMGLFVDKSGDVYVADEGNNRVQKWAPGATSGVTVATVATPTDVFVDGAGNLYVTNIGAVLKWAPGATSGVTVAGGNGAVAVFVDASGDIFVSDLLGSEVQEWTPGGNYLATVAGGNGPGSAANQLSYPDGVFVDSSGDLYVADTGFPLFLPHNNRVQEWAPGAISGVTVAGGNGPGSAADQLIYPTDVFVDGTGNIYITDEGNNRVQEFTPPAPPTTSILLPSKGATISGSTWLDASASSPIGVTSVTLEVSAGRSESNKVISSATPTLYGWLAGWDTTDLPNGTYTIRSVATDSLGHSTTSAGVTIKIENHRS